MDKRKFKFKGTDYAVVIGEGGYHDRRSLEFTRADGGSDEVTKLLSEVISIARKYEPEDCSPSGDAQWDEFAHYQELLSENFKPWKTNVYRNEGWSPPLSYDFEVYHWLKRLGADVSDFKLEPDPNYKSDMRY